MDNLVFADEVYAIQGAIFEVYKTLGSGFLEGVYQEALELELASRGIPYKSQPDITISYKGTQLRQTSLSQILPFHTRVRSFVRLTVPTLSAMKASYLN